MIINDIKYLNSPQYLCGTRLVLFDLISEVKLSGLKEKRGFKGWTGDWWSPWMGRGLMDMSGVHYAIWSVIFVSVKRF